MKQQKQPLYVRKVLYAGVIILIIVSMGLGFLITEFWLRAVVLFLVITAGIFVARIFVNRFWETAFKKDNDSGNQKNGLSEKIELLANSIQEVIQSGFAETIEIDGRRELIQIAQNFNYLLDNINDFIKEMDSISEETSGTSRQLADATQRTSRAMEKVSGTIQELTATTQEMNASVEEIAGGAQNIEQQTSQGLHKMEEMEAEMEKIMEVARQSAQKIRELNNASDEIENIIKVISDIAEQTNLLALNAAIEAARAGEEGRGFAVVADEVRKLAQDTQESLEEIGNLIDNLGRETGAAVDIIENNQQQIEEGEEVLQETASNFRKIASSIKEMVAEINQTSEASERIAEGTQEISVSLERQTEATSEIADLSNELSGMASELKETLAETDVGSMELEIDLADFDRDYSRVGKAEKQQLKRELGVSDQFILSMIARLEPMKGHDFLLSGLKKVFSRYDNVVCLIVGDGSLEERLKQKAVDLGIDDQVMFLGYRTDIPELLSITDLAVLTSEKEGMPPRIIMEAMAASRPIIATSVKGNKPLVKEGENGFLVDHGDEQRLAHKIGDFVENSIRTEEFGRQSRNHLEQLIERYQ